MNYPEHFVIICNYNILSYPEHKQTNKEINKLNQKLNQNDGSIVQLCQRKLIMSWTTAV